MNIFQEIARQIHAERTPVPLLPMQMSFAQQYPGNRRPRPRPMLQDLFQPHPFEPQFGNPNANMNLMGNNLGQQMRRASGPNPFLVALLEAQGRNRYPFGPQ